MWLCVQLSTLSYRQILFCTVVAIMNSVQHVLLLAAAACTPLRFSLVDCTGLVFPRQPRRWLRWAGSRRGAEELLRVPPQVLLLSFACPCLLPLLFLCSLLLSLLSLPILGVSFLVIRSVPYSPENREITERIGTEFCRTRFLPAGVLQHVSLIAFRVFPRGRGILYSFLFPARAPFVRFGY